MARHDETAEPAAPAIRRSWRWAFRARPREEKPVPRPDSEEDVLMEKTEKTYTLSVLLSSLWR